ncbi:MAG: hypothetical protein GTN40_03055 [Candidatus Aenigmarchaeota archaeon]|nr:hypothetical protein [Candidatus Aenigmarchaeota archaeon]
MVNKFEFKEDLWAEVEGALKERTPAGYKMAVIEANKLLDMTLKEKGYPGRDFDDRLLNARETFSNFDSLKQAVGKAKQILNTFDYNLTSVEVEDIINCYKQALMDLTEGFGSISFTKRASLFFKYYVPAKIKSVKFWIILFFSFLLLVKFLADTSWGQQITQFVVSIVRFIFSWFLVFVLFIVGITIVVFATFLYFEKRK